VCYAGIKKIELGCFANNPDNSQYGHAFSNMQEKMDSTGLSMENLLLKRAFFTSHFY